MADLPDGLRFYVEPSTQQLMACYQAGGGLAAPDEAALRTALAALGLADSLLDAPALQAFLAQCAQGSVADQPIGLRQDGHFELTVSANQLSVWLRIDPPLGGQAVSAAQIQAALAEQGIVHGLKPEAIQQALASGRCEQVLIAEGQEPQAGVAAQFECLLRPPGAAAEGDARPIDYRELGRLIVVDPGAPLMRRRPAVPGRPGRDVLGQEIAARAVPDLPFDAVSGAAVSPRDPELLLATISGSPSVGPRGVSVNPLVEVQDVDLLSGNIHFDGSVHVKGDIRSGMCVRVAGDVRVDGTVEAAEVIAGGHVLVKGGIIGRAEHGEVAAETARVRCQGGLHAKFIEHANVEAGGTVQVEAGIRDSEVVAGEAVLVGSSVVGGRTAAHRLVQAQALGDAWGAQTLVQVGLNPFLSARLAALAAEHRQRGEEAAKLRQLLAYLAQQPAKAGETMRERAELTLQACQTQLTELEAQMAALHAELEVSEQASIEVARQLHGGVRLLLGHSALELVEDRRGGRVHRVEGQLQID